MPAKPVKVENRDYGRRIKALMHHHGLGNTELARTLRMDIRVLNNAIAGEAKWSTFRNILDHLEGEDTIHSPDEIRTIRGFSERLAELDPLLVSVHSPTPYDAEPEWDIRKPICAVTNRELASLWANEHYFWNYEAKQHRYIQEENADIRRIFIVGGESSAATEERKATVLYRHQALGFNTRVFPAHCWGKVVRDLDVSCHMLVLQGTRRVIYFQHPYRDDPLSLPMVLETTDVGMIEVAIKRYNRLWEEEAQNPEWWLDTLRFTKKKRAEIKRKAALQANRVVRIAKAIPQKQADKPKRRK